MTTTPAAEPRRQSGRFDNGAEPIVMRVVVDGPSTAGKTSTARSLGEQFGRPVFTPAEEQGRTLLFDWMDHEGGRSDGRPIRTQVVAVPGHLPHLRARLLVTADVVIFVADTSRGGLERSRDALMQLRELLDALPEPAPGLIVQANKRDLPDAVPMGEVHRVLDLDDDQTVIESVATDGAGVRQAFVFAVRLGLRHIRASSEERTAERQHDAEALLAELDLDPRPMAEREAADARDASGPGLHHEMGPAGPLDERASDRPSVVADQVSEELRSDIADDRGEDQQPSEPSRWRRWLGNR